MYEYDEECLQTFILNQGQLFDEPVAETLEEAEAFLEDCMASIVDNIGEVREFLDQEGMVTVECLTKRLKMHQKYLRYRMVVILSLKDKSKKTKVPAGWHRTGRCQM